MKTIWRLSVLLDNVTVLLYSNAELTQLSRLAILQTAGSDRVLVQSG